ncbi:MAG: class I SAM-dependent methyltransferase [Solirubrobacteraceae bacterium]
MSDRALDAHADGPTEADQSGSSRYAVPIDLDSRNSHSAVIELVGTGHRVLDVGCAGGLVAEVLSDRGNTVVGIDADPDAISRAAGVCERAILADLDTLDLSVLAGERFDVILAADVLEHLKNPVDVLRRLSSLLSPGGFVVASVPNVAHASVRLALMQGTFPYAEVGLLDRTHLRFFTRSTLRDAFEDAALAIVGLYALDKALEHSEVPFDDAGLPPELLEQLSTDPEALAYQYVVVAVPVPPEGPPALAQHLHRLIDELDASRADRRAIEDRSKALGAECTALTARNAALAGELRHSAAREQELRELVREAHVTLADREAQLAERDGQLAGATAAAAAVAGADQLAHLDARDQRIQAMEATRAWRAAKVWWRLKQHIVGHW